MSGAAKRTRPPASAANGELTDDFFDAVDEAYRLAGADAQEAELKRIVAEFGLPWRDVVPHSEDGA